MNIRRNRKAILFILVIIISPVIVAGIVIIVNSDNENYSYRTFYGDIYFEYSVSHCGDCDLSDKFRINVSFLEKKVIVKQNFSSYCVPSATDINYFRIELELLNNNLTVREIFDNKGAPVSLCVTSFRIIGEIVNLTTGIYNLTFIDENRYIGQTTILEVFEIIMI